MADATFDELVSEAATAPFRGWDFSWLAGRAEEVQPPWDYLAEARLLLADSSATLDIDTGGGEVLARLFPLSGLSVATEGYVSNISVAAARLSPLGVHVVGTESAPDNVDQYPRTSLTPTGTSSHLPFQDRTFDVVLNRHSSYWPGEVSRVLRAGGTFLTQQRDLDGNAQLQETFGRPQSSEPAFNVTFAVGQLEEHDFEVAKADEVSTPMRFFDVGAVVYYLRAVPWLVPDFDLQGDRAALLQLYEETRRTGSVTISGHHMLLKAVRRAG
jgi:hypothetical protein